MKEKVTKAILLAVTGLCMWAQALDVTISWNPTTTTNEGEPLDSVQGYKVFYSYTPGVFSNVIEVVGNTDVVLRGLEYNRTVWVSVQSFTSSAESDLAEPLEWTSPVMPDADKDGMSDEWEIEHFQTLSISQETTDYDGDGFSDRVEFVAGTDPSASADYPEFKIHADAGGMSVSFLAKASAGMGYENRTRRYSLFQCEDLSSGVWTAVSGAEDIFAEDQMVSCNVHFDSKNIFFHTEISLD